MLKSFMTAFNLNSRKRTENELHRIAARLEEAQRIAHFGWWERDFRTNHVLLSDELCLIFGAEPADIPIWHERWLKLIHPEDRERIAEASDAAVRGGPRYDVEYRVLRPDGSERVVHSRGNVTWDDAGRPLRQFGVLQDITELRQAERELRASEARFRVFVDHAMDAFFMLDDKSIVLDVNRQACISLGYSREELVGMHPRDFDVGLDEASMVRLSQRIAEGKTLAFETRHRRKDGTSFPVEILAARFGQGDRQLCLVRDITERKRAEDALKASEERFRTLFEKANDAIFLENDRDEIVEVNERACALLGYSRQELLAMKVADLQPPELRGKVGSVVGHELERHGGATFETIDLHRSGRRIPVEITNTLIFDQGQKLVLSVVKDITERKRAAEALQQMQDQLTHANRVATMGQLTASIAHEIAQPISAVSNFANAAINFLNKDAPDLKEVEETIGDIAHAADRAREIIDRIRDQIKKAPPRKDVFDLNQAIQEVLFLVGNAISKDAIVLQTSFAEKLPSVRGDRVQLQQVVLNLVLNAVEALRLVDDRPRVLQIVTDPKESVNVLVTISDTGPGIAPENLERIFESFFTTKSSGVGIGLSICRSIIEAHGGSLWASSNEPSGARLQFTLPAAPASA